MGISRVSVNIKSVNSNIAGLGLAKCNPRDVASVRSSVNRLWGPMTSLIHEQAANGHRCSLNAEPCGLGLRIDGKNLGTLRDPLGLARSMISAGISGLDFFPDQQGIARAGHLEKTMVALLSGGFKPVETSTVTVHVLDDLFVDEAQKGLPVSPNISYIVAEKPSSVLTSTAPRYIDCECKKLMAASRKYISPDMPIELRDVDSAIGIWSNILDIDTSFSQKTRIISTVCHIARQIYDLEAPMALRDMPNVIRLWNFAKQVIDTDERLAGEAERLRKAMMDMTDKCSLAEAPASDRDIDSSIMIYRAVISMWDREDHRRRALFSMVNKAGEITSFNIPFEERDFEGALKIWRAIRELDSGEGVAVKDTLVKTANRLMASHRKISEPEVEAALMLWSEAYETESSEPLRSGVISNAVKVLHINARSLAVDVLQRETGSVNSNFRLRCLANLYYLTKDLAHAIRIIDANFMFDREMLYLKAECLRKQRKYDESIVLATAIINSEQDNGIFARLQAYLCRGYCVLVLSRKKGAQELGDALSDFDKAISMAAAAGMPVPPRAYTGKAIAFMSMGDRESARQCAMKALELDPRNDKAEKLLSSIRP